MAVVYTFFLKRCASGEKIWYDYKGKNHSQADVSLIPSHNFICSLQIQPLDFYQAVLTSLYLKPKLYNHFLKLFGSSH